MQTCNKSQEYREATYHDTRGALRQSRDLEVITRLRQRQTGRLTWLCNINSPNMLNIFVLPGPKGAEEMQKDPDPVLKPFQPSCWIRNNVTKTMHVVPCSGCANWVLNNSVYKYLKILCWFWLKTQSREHRLSAKRRLKPKLISSGFESPTRRAVRLFASTSFN